jgi:hypothetical protein
VRKRFLEFLESVVPEKHGVFLTPELLELLKVPARIRVQLLTAGEVLPEAKSSSEPTLQNETGAQAAVGGFSGWLDISSEQLARRFEAAVRGTHSHDNSQDAPTSDSTHAEKQGTSISLAELERYFAFGDFPASPPGYLTDRILRTGIRDLIYELSAAENRGILPFDVAVHIATIRMKAAFRPIDPASTNYLMGLLTIDTFKGDEDWSEAVVQRMLKAQRQYWTYWALRVATLLTEGRYLLPSLDQWRRDLLGGFIETPPKPKGKPPYELFHRNVLIVSELRAMADHGLAPTRAMYSDHKQSGCDAIAAALTNLGKARGYAAVENIWAARNELRHPSLLR